jgi:L-cysteine:1D-myo-inositol 2-amino-2-deoxy-alpha-D-glucopyranoside ligase
VPFTPGLVVTMYTCGITPYDATHVGHAAVYLTYDVLQRRLRDLGHDTRCVRNITDVDDDLLRKARELGVHYLDLAAAETARFDDDVRALGLLPAWSEPRATSAIADIRGFIGMVLDQGYAYQAGGGVYFDVSRFERFGQISHLDRDEMLALAAERGGNVDDPHKHDALDFVLWQPSADDEPSWESLWGPGRPGWHIECSVMATKYLGMGFDIHGGGADLIFPHHENEIAQAEALAGAPFVRHWAHSGLVQMDDEKMSKSLGNVALARDVLERYPGEAVRYWALTGSYRTQVSFSEAAMDDALHAYERWRTFHDAARHALRDDMPPRPPNPRRPPGEEDTGVGRGFSARFVEAMDDDFNSAGALGAVHELVREANKCVAGAQRGDDSDRDALRQLTETFLELTSVLGFSFPSPAEDSELLDGLVTYLLELRDQARAERAFDRADGIRARLRELGIAVEDTPAGSRWRLGG